MADKLAIAAMLDELGVHYLEGGWPGANPADTAFFAAMAAGEVPLKHATLVSFGFTRRVGMRAADDPLTAALRAHTAGELAAQLQYALDYRVTIERGVGYLMARDGVDVLTAFNRLRRAARGSRRKIGDVAEELLTTGELPR